MLVNDRAPATQRIHLPSPIDLVGPPAIPPDDREHQTPIRSTSRGSLECNGEAAHPPPGINVLPSQGVHSSGPGARPVSNREDWADSGPDLRQTVGHDRSRQCRTASP